MEEAIIIDGYKETDFVYQTSGHDSEKYFTITHKETKQSLIQKIDESRPEHGQRQLLLLRLIVKLQENKLG